jgi:PKD repeat protein
MKIFLKLVLITIITFSFGDASAQCPNTLGIDLLQQNGNTVTVATTFQAPSGTGIYVWNFDDGTSETSGWMTSHSYSQPGLYIIQLNLYDSLNTTWCASGILTVQITAQQTCDLQVSYNIANLPNGQVEISGLNVANGVAPLTYYWWFSDGQESTNANPSLFFNNGFYNACLTVEDANGCYDSLCTSFSVTNGPCQTDYISAQPNIQGNELSLAIFNNSNFSYPINLIIDYGDGSSQTGQMSTAYTNFHLYPENNTTYNLCIIATDANNCTETLCFPIVTGPCMNNSTFFTSIPGQNNTFQFIASDTGAAPIQYTWNFGDNSGNTVESTPNTFHIYSQPGTYTVCLTTTDANGCVGNHCQPVTVQPPCASFLVNSTVSYDGLTATITPQVTNSCGGLVYSWSDPQATITGNNPATFTYPSYGNYQAVLTVIDDCGCTQTITILLSLDCNNASGVQTNVFMQNGTVTTCNGLFTDSGGQSGQYLNNQNQTLTVYPGTSGGRVRVNFTSFASEANYDYLRIANGNNANAPTLANLNGTITNPGSYTSTAADGSLTFRWTSDISNVNAGWVANITCLDLNIMSTNLQDGTWELTAQSSTNYIDYIWLINNQTYVTTTPSLVVPLPEGYNQICVTASSSQNCSQDACIQLNVPCTYQLDADFIINGNQVDVVINNYDSTLYYSLYGQNSQVWAQLTSDTTSFTFPTAINDLFCIWADGPCYDSTCVQVTLSTEGTQIISGTVWDDSNGNGVMDAGELPLSNIYVTLCAGTDSLSCIYAYTDPNGMYTFNVYPGTYTVQSLVWQTNYLPTTPIGGMGYLIEVEDQSLGQFNFGWQNQSVTISGVVFYDTNNNGVQDIGENPATYKAVQIGNSVVYTNVNGAYTIQKLPGTYAISMVNPGAGYSISVPASGSYNVSASNMGQVYDGYNFGLWADPQYADLSATIDHISTVTPGFPVMNYLSYCNNGVAASSGQYTIYWDPMLAISTGSVFSPAPTTFDAAGNTATWTINNIAPGQCGHIYMNAPAPQSLVLGNPVFTAVIINPLNDSNPSNNIDTLHQVVVGSWDPNDKQGVPAGIGVNGIIFPNTNLSYTIRFQNTGNAPAVNVVLIDTISSDFILENFHMRSSSHNYNVQVDQESRVIRWTFNNIMLPDSLSDPLGSIGFVNFSIDPIQNQADGTILNNFADIYFDFNEPIRTNTTIHTIDRLLGVENTSNGPKVQVYPNPFTGSTSFLVNSSDQSASEVIVHDVLGKVVSRFLIESGKPYVYSASNLSSGMYFYSVKNNSTTSTGKLIVK